MAARILHVSDLHTGTREDPEVEAAVRSLLGRVEAELIVASGDLTHRGLRKQHERAHRFLTSFGLPVLTVPGNHDMPYTFPARFTRTYEEFTRLWGEVEQTYSSPSLHVYEVGERALITDTYIWRGSDWGLTARRMYPRGLGPLAVTG